MGARRWGKEVLTATAATAAVGTVAVGTLAVGAMLTPDRPAVPTVAPAKPSAPASDTPSAAASDKPSAPASDTPGRGTPPPDGSSLAAPVDRIRISVVHDPVTGRAEMSPVLPVPRLPPQVEGSDVEVAAYDADGTVLARVSPTETWVGVPDSPGSGPGPTFIVAVLEIELAALERLELTLAGDLVGSWQASAGAPQVHDLEAMVVGDEVAVSWDASDPDGDPLEHSVLVSDDDGETWQMMASWLSKTQTTMPLWAVPGGDILVRVLSSDGIRFAEAQVPLTVG